MDTRSGWVCARRPTAALALVLAFAAVEAVAGLLARPGERLGRAARRRRRSPRGGAGGHGRGQLGRALAAHPGVADVHDLHVWTITSGFPSLSVHVVEAGADCHEIRAALERGLHERLGLDHTTLQVEHLQGLVQIGRG